jgi:DNA/RNA-binding domain of Phe-tRNA-synthetase-like protein
MLFSISKNLVEKYPEAQAGVLVMRQVQNPASYPGLEKRKREIEAELRSRFAGNDPQKLAATPPLQAYVAYYKRFDKSYHVLGQLNSIVYKEKSIPSVAALVEAMFMAELKNGLLTAGHDLDRVHPPVTLNVACDEEHYTVMRGADQALKAGDMFIADQEGVLSSILYGPDQRTQITSETKNVLFTVYAPEGVDTLAVEYHLNDIRDLVLMVSPQARVELLQVFGAKDALQ